MTEQDNQMKREELKIVLKKHLKAKVRGNRTAEKVLELEVMMIEDQLDMLRLHEKELKWRLGYLEDLDPMEIELGS